MEELICNFQTIYFLDLAFPFLKLDGVLEIQSVNLNIAEKIEINIAEEDIAEEDNFGRR